MAASAASAPGLGLECSGEVEAVGSEVQADVHGLKAGDRVMGSAPGGFAEFVATDAGRVHRIPANNMTYEQAACFPVALQTMHNAVVTAGRLKRGETFLMQGASAGMGLMGMQIAKFMGAAVVIGTSTNAARRARLKDYGADVALDSSEANWPAEVKKATGGKGVDLIVDLISAGVANANLEAAALLGRIVNVGRLGGNKGEFDFDKHALKRIDYIGVTFRTRTPKRFARSIACCGPICGRRSKPARCRCRSTRPIRWPRSPTRSASCVPIRISARSSLPCHKQRSRRRPAIPGLPDAAPFGINLS